MAVAENASQNFENTTTVVSSEGSNAENDLEKSKPRNDFVENKSDQKEKPAATNFSVDTGNYKAQMGQMANGFDSNGAKSQQMGMVKSTGVGSDGGYEMANGLVVRNGEDESENFKREMSDMRDLEELLSKLNPLAEEFVPPSLANNHGYFGAGGFGYANNFVLTNFGNANGLMSRRRKNGYIQGKRRMNGRMTPAQREAMIRRTVYVSDIDQQVTEEQLAALFLGCGQVVVDCRVCGDPNSILRFAFIEFTDEEGARAALSLSGTVLGYYPVRVLPSKTAISPVNPTFLPRSEDEREMCSRTIYCTNIDKKVTQADVKLFFESLCGEVQRLRLLGDYHHSTRIAFVEFTVAESAIAALNCSGVVLGSLPIRVSPSKTPVRPRVPRPQLH
ncbi:polyadenylate-binding protein-interacting protein 12-like isoform X1 [Quercus lobata]|uniref:polyadenylate-binding protein-interacting protein 12-like isoform X1 n=1 Tax=Quercus lobata TaxID=97700 RepID=UPI0012452F1C|nr:polyadenylate-binding protein-interacting protein 12-like isoform X1 [Quercus lobata]XP_030934293.1 polyadenylate-binding protein-interacting protein 12-like isoform X1 [Quercus lobata]